MKKYSFIVSLMLPLAVIACKGEENPDDGNPDSGSNNGQNEEVKPSLVAPSNLNVSTPGGAEATITWENASTDYDGVDIEKAVGTGKYKRLTTLSAGVFTYTDTDFTENGSYSYRLCSFKGLTYSDYASVDFTIEGIPDPVPMATISKVETAPNMIVVRFSITEDLGKTVENGIVWSYTSASPELGKDETYTYWKKLRTGSDGVGVIFDPTGTVTLRAYAKSTSGDIVGYSDPVTATPDTQPAPYDVTYTDITPGDFPSEIKVYNATKTMVTGRPLNIWYAIADLSTGNVVLRTLCPNGYAKTSEWPKTHTESPYVFTNGGYFYTTSLSYVLDQGVFKAENDHSLSRKYTYPTARGVFGVTEDAKTSVCWRYGGTVGGGPYFYDVPIHQIDGATPLKPSATYPAPAIDPGYYSAIGGGPVLVKDGKIQINFLAEDESLADADKCYLSNFELFYTDIFNKSTRQPRTAIGRRADGKVVLMVVDGRNSGVSEGVVLTDMARLMTGVGCVDVLNLDGGGSSTFCVGNDLQILNRPSSNNVERSVISMVGFARK